MKYVIMLLLFQGLFSLSLTNDQNLNIVIPEHGFKNLDSGPPCPLPNTGKWQYVNSGNVTIAFYANGPEGSGHFWQIIIGLTPKPNTLPDRGVCLKVSTIGWHHRRLPDQEDLFWLKDLDNDGKPELIIWDSTPLSSDSVYTAYTLRAQVFRFDGYSTFYFQKELSQQLNNQLVPATRVSKTIPRNFTGRKQNKNVMQKGIFQILDSLSQK